MAEDFEYVSHSRLEYHEGLRRAFLGDVPEPVVYGVQGKLREYYGAREGPPIASTLDHIVAAVAEHLEVDDRAHAEVCARRRRRAREARVRKGRHARAEALGRPQPRDGHRVTVQEPPLARHVEVDPRREGEAVAEAGVDGVLEVRVRVDEARKEDGVGVAAPLALELRGRPDGLDTPVHDGDASTGHGLALDRDDPVGLVDDGVH